MKLTKVEELGVNLRVTQLLGMGYPQSKTSQIINQEFGLEGEKALKATHIAVFVRKCKSAKAITMRRKETYLANRAEEVDSVTINVNNQLSELNEKMSKELNDLLTEGEHSPQIVQIAKHVLDQLKFQAKLTGELKGTPQTQYNINILELGPKISSYMMKMRKEKKLYCRTCNGTDIGMVEGSKHGTNYEEANFMGD